MAKKLDLEAIESTKKTEIENEAETKVKDFSDFIKGYQTEYEAARGSMSVWKSKQVKLYQQRYGIRPPTTYPWAGASSISLPLQDKTIRKLKAEDVAAIWNTFPVCDFQPMSGQSQEQAERNAWDFDYLIRTEINPYAELNIAADRRMQMGFTVLKTIYEFSTEPKTVIVLRDEMENELKRQLRNPDQADILSNPVKIELLMQAMSAIWGFDREDQSDSMKMLKIANEFYSGTEKFEFTIDEEIYNNPKIIVMEPGEDFIVPVGTDAVFDFEKARWIDHIEMLEPDELWSMALIGKFDINVTKAVLEKYQINPEDLNKVTFDSPKAISQSTYKTNQDSREGIKREGSTTGIKVHEVCLWYDSDGDGKPEKHIMNYCEDYMDAPLRLRKYGYKLKRWPYIKIPFELTGYRNLSPRGTVEIQSQIATSINMQENTKNNRQTLSTTPTLFFRGGKFNPKNMTGIPGQPVSVDGDPRSAVDWKVAPGYDGSFLQEEQYLKLWGEEIVSGPDVGSPLNLIPSKDKKGQAFMQTVSSDHISTRGLDIQIWQYGWALVFENLRELHLQYGPDEKLSASDADGNLKKITIEEKNGKYRLSCGGKFGISSPLLEAQKSQARFHELWGNPFIDQYELVREYITKQDPRMAKLLLKPKEQVAQEQQQQQQMALQNKVVDAQLGLKTKQVQKQQRQSIKVTGGAAGGSGSHVQKNIGG